MWGEGLAPIDYTPAACTPLDRARVTWHGVRGVRRITTVLLRRRRRHHPLSSCRHPLRPATASILYTVLYISPPPRVGGKTFSSPPPPRAHTHHCSETGNRIIYYYFSENSPAPPARYCTGTYIIYNMTTNCGPLTILSQDERRL